MYCCFDCVVWCRRLTKFCNCATVCDRSWWFIADAAVSVSVSAGNARWLYVGWTLVLWRSCVDWESVMNWSLSMDRTLNTPPPRPPPLLSSTLSLLPGYVQFRPHRSTAVLDASCCYKQSGVVCLCNYWSQWQVVQKRMNQSKCRFGGNQVQIPQGKGQLWKAYSGHLFTER